MFCTSGMYVCVSIHMYWYALPGNYFYFYYYYVGIYMCIFLRER